MLVPLSNPASYNVGIYKAKQLVHGELEAKISYQQRLADLTTLYRQNTARVRKSNPKQAEPSKLQYGHLRS